MSTLPWTRGRLAGVTSWISALLVCLASLTRVSNAQAVQPHEAWDDAKAYFTAPLRWDKDDWLFFGGTVAALAVTHEADDNVRDHFTHGDANALDGKDSHSLDDALPAAVLVAGTWVLAGLADEPAGWRELGSMLESSAFTLVSTELFKLSFGRERPNETADPDKWFAGGDAFPSMHSGLAFAIGTVFAESGSEDHRWLRRILGYGVAGTTAYLRLDHNAHWTTDVMAGAALGFSTARFTMNRRSGVQSHSSLSLVPANGGLMLAFTKPLH